MNVFHAQRGPYPRQGEALYRTLRDAQADVAITDLYRALYPDKDATDLDQRGQQQRLGPFIVRLNRRLKKQGQAIKPGERKGTYRLVVL